MNKNDVVIVAAARTPLCRSKKGALVGVNSATLLQTALQGVLQKARVDAGLVENVCVGTVLEPPQGFVGLRMASMVAGLETASFETVNRQCASGLQAVAHIAHAIQTGTITMGIGAGVESMSSHSMRNLQPPAVNWSVMQQNSTAMDCLLPMGITSDTVAVKYKLQRHVLDDWSVQSHYKAATAQQAGKFDAEIVPVVIQNESGGSPRVVEKDDGIRFDTNRAHLSKLKPAFSPAGLTTAGNSSQTTDGAAAVLLTTRRHAHKLGLPIAGIWRGFACQSVPPAVMGIGPAVAIPAVLQQTGLVVDDIDVFEINEAFASQVVWCVDQLQLPLNKVNPNGGAIALGHPLGCTGARLIASILPELQRCKGRYGVVSMCVGTGMGAAAVFEMEPQSAL